MSSSASMNKFMKRKVFYSFHYVPDNWRAAQVRNMGVVEGDEPTSDNDWESIKSRGDNAIKSWIDRQMTGTSCTVVLVGAATANRPWINYEIAESWRRKKGVVGVCVYGLQDRFRQQSNRGANPFQFVRLNDRVMMPSVVKLYDSPYADSNDVYSHIRRNLADWIEDAIAVRARH